MPKRMEQPSRRISDHWAARYFIPLSSNDPVQLCAYVLPGFADGAVGSSKRRFTASISTIDRSKERPALLIRQARIFAQRIH